MSPASWLIGNGSIAEDNRSINSTKGIALGKVSFKKRKLPEAPHFACRNNVVALYDGNLYNIEQLKSSLKEGHAIHTGSASEVVTHILEENYQGNLIEAIKGILPLLDGDYCLAASDGIQVTIARDTAGLKPVFYAQTDELVAFA